MTKLSQEGMSGNGCVLSVREVDEVIVDKNRERIKLKAGGKEDKLT